MGDDVAVRIGLRGEEELLAAVTVICRGGMGVLDAYRIAGRVLDGRTGAAATTIARRLEEGVSLGRAARESIRRIDPVHAAMLDVADECASAAPLERARSHVGARRRLASHAWTVAIYPAFIVLLSLGAAALLLAVVIPTIAELRVGLGVEDGLDAFASGRVAVIGIAAGAAAASLLAFPLVSRPGAAAWTDRVRLLVPVVGRLEALVDLLAFTNALAAMQAVGGTSVEGARLGASSARNRVIRAALERVAAECASGAPLGAALRGAVPRMPAVARRLALIDHGADESGALAGLAAALEAQLDAMRERISSLLEPLLVAAAGGVLLLLVLSLVVPLLELTAGVVP